MKTSFKTLCLTILLALSVQTVFGQSSTPEYTITVEEVPNLSVTGLHSFVYGRQGNELLIIGGRTNGYHSTDAANPGSTFPASMANQKLRVIDFTTGKEWTANIPKAQFEQFTSTNAQYYQDGNTLFVAGGYGVNNQGEHQTYPTLSAVNVSKMIAAVKNGKTKRIAKSITSITNEGFRVTGGELQKVDDKYYMVFGQNFVGTYSQAITGIYVNEIREFDITYKSGKLSAIQTATFKDGNRPDATTRFHRRDLNVVPQIMADDSEGVAVYGGVFTQKVNGAFLNPVIMSKTQGKMGTEILENFTQQMSQYACASVLVYDASSKSMFTTLMGGISVFAYNAQGQLEPDFGIPWIKTITTYVRKGDGTYEERIQGAGYSVSLPAFIGGESKFIPLSGLAYGNSHEILDFSKVSTTSDGLIGYLFGGIVSQKAQSSNLYPTSPNTKIYKVYLKVKP